MRDPLVYISNQTSDTVLVDYYTDMPGLKSIKRGQTKVPSGAVDFLSPEGVDYYARKNSGALKNQKNHIFVLVYTMVNGKKTLKSQNSREFELYGADALNRDKRLDLFIKVAPDYSITVEIHRKRKP